MKNSTGYPSGPEDLFFGRDKKACWISRSVNGAESGSTALGEHLVCRTAAISDGVEVVRALTPPRRL